METLSLECVRGGARRACLAYLHTNEESPLAEFRSYRANMVLT